MRVIRVAVIMVMFMIVAMLMPVRVISVVRMRLMMGWGKHKLTVVAGTGKLS